MHHRCIVVAINFIKMNKTDIAEGALAVGRGRKRVTLSLSEARNRGRGWHVELLVDFGAEVLVEEHLELFVLPAEACCLLD